MLDTPAISVVIPTYNAAKFLREALDSLLAQTFTNWEAVCVNDGSTDNSLEILQEYAARDSRFRILDGPNGGYGKAMNRGMDAAAGKYLAILEPDDFLPAHAYEALYSAAEEHDLDIARGAVCHFWQEKGERVYKYEGDHFADQVVFCPLDHPRFLRFAPNTWTGLYRLEYLRANNIRHNETPGASYQDNGMFCISTLCAKRMMLIADVVYMYRIDNPASSIHNTVGKPYATMEEFRYIRAELEKRPQIWERAKTAFCDMATGGMLWTYARISEETRPAYLKRLKEEFSQLALMGFSTLPDDRRRLVESLLEKESSDEFVRMYAEKSIPTGRKEPYTQVRCGGIVHRTISASGTITRIAGIPVFTRRREPEYRTLAGVGNMLYCNRDTYRILGIPVACRIYDCHSTILKALGVTLQKNAKL